MQTIEKIANDVYSDREVTPPSLCVRIEIANSRPDFLVRNGLFIALFLLLSILIHIEAPVTRPVIDAALNQLRLSRAVSLAPLRACWYPYPDEARVRESKA
jgi:hypothetical protein